MPGNVFVPFNNRPFSTDVKTSSYTIPSGYFARVFAVADAGATVTVDSDTLLSNSGGVSLAAVNLNDEGETYTIPAGNYFEGLVSVSSGISSARFGDGTFTIPLALNAITYNLKFGPGTIIESHTGTGNVWILGYLKSSDTVATADVWVKTGAVVNGTGTWRAFVMLYADIT